MSQQEEIRKIIDLYTDDTCLYPDNDCEFRGSDVVGGYCVSGDGSYNCLMKRLDELDVVIKVERELPKISVGGAIGKDNAHFVNGFEHAESRYKHAGYVAVESLTDDS